MSNPDFRQFLDIIGYARPRSVSGEMSLSDLVLGKLTNEQFRVCPERLNSIAWLLWHISRTDDVWQTYFLGGGTQLLDQGWDERLGVRWRDIGTGMPRGEMEELSATIDIDALKEYHAAIASRCGELVAALPSDAWDAPGSESELERAGDEGVFGRNAAWVPDFWRNRTVGSFMVSMAWHNYLHLGEMMPTRSMIGARTGG